MHDGIHVSRVLHQRVDAEQVFKKRRKSSRKKSRK